MGQMSFKKTGLPSLSMSKRLFFQIDIDSSGDRKSDDKRRRHQKVGFDRAMDARFKIAIAAEARWLRSDHVL